MGAGTGATAHGSGDHEVPAFDSAGQALTGSGPSSHQTPAPAGLAHQPSGAAAGSGAQALQRPPSVHGAHDLVGHGDEDDHGAADDAWVLLPLAVGLLIGLVLAMIIGLATSAASIV